MDPPRGLGLGRENLGVLGLQVESSPSYKEAKSDPWADPKVDPPQASIIYTIGVCRDQNWDQKVDPPGGSIIYIIGVFRSQIREFYFLDFPGVWARELVSMFPERVQNMWCLQKEPSVHH